MAPSLEVTTVPVVEEIPSPNKTVFSVEIQPVPENNSSHVPSTSNSYTQSASSAIEASYPKFELEEYPIDKVREIRVSSSPTLL